MKFLKMALLAGAALLVASPARAQSQDDWMRVVVAQLDAVVHALGDEGLSPAGEMHSGTLDEGDSDEVELRLEAGDYMIVGACDHDCSDLDLALLQNGEEIESDYELDDTPVLVVEVPKRTTYTLRVDMATCSEAPCRYGVRVFSQD